MSLESAQAESTFLHKRREVFSQRLDDLDKGIVGLRHALLNGEEGALKRLLVREAEHATLVRFLAFIDEEVRESSLRCDREIRNMISDSGRRAA